MDRDKTCQTRRISIEHKDILKRLHSEDFIPVAHLVNISTRNLFNAPVSYVTGVNRFHIGNILTIPSRDMYSKQVLDELKCFDDHHHQPVTHHTIHVDRECDICIADSGDDHFIIVSNLPYRPSTALPQIVREIVTVIAMCVYRFTNHRPEYLKLCVDANTRLVFKEFVEVEDELVILTKQP